MSEVNLNGLGGNYGYYQTSNSKTEEKQETQKTQETAEKAQVSPDKVLDAMSMLGAQNLVNIQAKVEINPANFLTDDRIASIEDSMAAFEQGVEVYADAIKSEFGNVLNNADIYSLAAKAFALG